MASKPANVEITKVIIVGNQKKTVVASQYKQMYGWSKYGEPNYGLVQKNKTPEWHCQACGDRQTDSLPSFMCEVVEREYVRICTLCQHIKVARDLHSVAEIIEVVRHH